MNNNRHGTGVYKYLRGNAIVRNYKDDIPYGHIKYRYATFIRPA
jgi:hypothetical protein